MASAYTSTNAALENGVSVIHNNGGTDIIATTAQQNSPNREQPRKKDNCLLVRGSHGVIWALETGFFRLGLFVGKHPVLTIVLCVIMCGLCGLGLKTFHETDDQIRLWVPQTSRVIPEQRWVDETFPQETRYVSYLLVEPGGDVLTPKFLNALMDYYIEAGEISIKDRKFNSMCVSVGRFCYASSLLELWQYEESQIRALNRTSILEKVNTTIVSPVSGVEVETLLGGKITRDKQGMIIHAEATKITWVLKKEENNNDAASWEREMIQMALRGHPNISQTMVYASRSFDDEGYGAINSDINLLTAGFIIVFVFIMLSLGKFNLLEQKIAVSMSGMLCVGLSILVAYGLATTMDVIYGPIHAIMPFLLLGIGVDDMFVVIETWKHLSPEEGKLTVPQKLAMTLSRAGVSITVTSITDIVAFGIGATTVIPALSSFCIYATLGIMALFLLVSTLFSAVLAIDEYRRRARYDACICCYKHKPSYAPYSCSTRPPLVQTFFGKYYGPFIMKRPCKVIIILIAVATAGVMLWRFVQMKQDFDQALYIPSDSYAYAYRRAKEGYFDTEGVEFTIYCGGFNYYEQMDNLNGLVDDLSTNDYIQKGTINSWFTAFHTLLEQSGINVTSEDEYYHQLYQYLHSRAGQRFASFVKFNSSKEPVSIVGSYITMTHSLQPNSQEDVKAMDAVRNLIDSEGFPEFSEEGSPTYMCFSYAIQYLSFETNKVLQEELYRNLGLAGGAVFVMTVILVANLWTSILVLVCVLFTVIDVGGIQELWGTTIDTASSILLTLCVGLAVDYSAHIGHTFMTIQGDRDKRAIVTLKSIGPAVFNGGLSTFLAFILLADSASYGFQLFFRIFSMVVVFGLFHGLVFLPVLLSIAGPGAYRHADEIPEEIELPISKSSSNHNGKVYNRNGEETNVEMSEHVYDGPYQQQMDELEAPRSDNDHYYFQMNTIYKTDAPGPSQQTQNENSNEEENYQQRSHHRQTDTISPNLQASDQGNIKNSNAQTNSNSKPEVVKEAAVEPHVSVIEVPNLVTGQKKSGVLSSRSDEESHSKPDNDDLSSLTRL